jgi:hypothetical protein
VLASVDGLDSVALVGVQILDTALAHDLDKMRVDPTGETSGLGRPRGRLVPVRNALSVDGRCAKLFD